LLENYRLLQERQPEIGGALSCQRMLAFLLHFNNPIRALFVEIPVVLIAYTWSLQWLFHSDHYFLID